jgi:hypothetical protein
MARTKVTVDQLERHVLASRTTRLTPHQVWGFEGAEDQLVEFVRLRGELDHAEVDPATAPKIIHTLEARYGMSIDVLRMIRSQVDYLIRGLLPVEEKEEPVRR